MSRIRPSWDEYFMLLAKLAAVRSTCNSRLAGAVIVRERQVLATGYNGALSGQPHCLGREMPCLYCGGSGCAECGGLGRLPYCHRRALAVSDRHKQHVCRSNHAEANAVALAAKHGISIAGADVYCTLAPCAVCLKLLKAAGIRRIYYETAYDGPTLDGLCDADDFVQVRISPSLHSLLPGLLQPTSQRCLKRTC